MADRYVELTGIFEPGVKYECYPQGDYAKLQRALRKIKATVATEVICRTKPYPTAFSYEQACEQIRLFRQVQAKIKEYYGGDGGFAALQDGHHRLKAENAKLKEVLHKMLDNSILWLPTVEACYENPDEARALLALECIIKKALKEKPC